MTRSRTSTRTRSRTGPSGEPWRRAWWHAAERCWATTRRRLSQKSSRPSASGRPTLASSRRRARRIAARWLPRRSLHPRARAKTKPARAGRQRRAPGASTTRSATAATSVGT
eukprot:Amastigsp_a677504_11.p3 type:complete len:112 gc:universal Amastigsp_a677504_11:574-239(-)